MVTADDAILTLDKAAAYLKAKQRTTRHLTVNSKTPVSQLVNLWRFHRTEPNRWMANPLDTYNHSKSNEGDS